eukprot:XP_001689870.1 predicted protein [Chlamydomonas reinhardtii]
MDRILKASYGDRDQRELNAIARAPSARALEVQAGYRERRAANPRQEVWWAVQGQAPPPPVAGGPLFWDPKAQAGLRVAKVAELEEVMRDTLRRAAAFATVWSRFGLALPPDLTAAFFDKYGRDARGLMPVLNFTDALVMGGPRLDMAAAEGGRVQRGAYLPGKPATHTGKILYPECKKEPVRVRVGQRHVPPDRQAALQALAFSPDGSRLAAVATDNSHCLHLWDWARARPLCQPRKSQPGAPPAVYGVVWSKYEPDSSCTATTGEGVASCDVWEVDKDPEVLVYGQQGSAARLSPTALPRALPPGCRPPPVGRAAAAPPP